jgi:DNA-binding transcriptional LysR family regulator
MDDDIPEIRSSDFTLVELNRIRLLCEKRSFSKAAELAGVSQSALSQSIGLLEDRLGVTLFERTRRSVRPTQIAHYITSQAASILNAVQQIDDHIAEIKGAHFWCALCRVWDCTGHFCSQ